MSDALARTFLERLVLVEQPADIDPPRDRCAGERRAHARLVEHAPAGFGLLECHDIAYLGESGAQLRRQRKGSELAHHP